MDHFNFLKVKVSFSNVPDSQIGSTPMLSNGGFAKCTLKQCAGQYCNANVWFRSMQCEAMQVHADQEQCTEVACKSFTPESKSFAQQISPSGLCLGSVYTARSRHRSPPPPPKTQNPPTTTVQVYTTHQVTQNKKLWPNIKYQTPLPRTCHQRIAQNPKATFRLNRSSNECKRLIEFCERKVVC